MHKINKGTVAIDMSPQKVKHHPLPMASIIGLTTALAAAPSRHLTRLFAALAVAVLFLCKSITSTLSVLKPDSIRKPMRFNMVIGPAILT